MDFLKVYPGEQKGTEDTYREQVKERMKVEEELGHRGASIGDSPQGLHSGASSCKMQGNDVARADFLPRSVLLGKITFIIQ